MTSYELPQLPQANALPQAKASPANASENNGTTERPRYWRSLSELNSDETFVNDFLHREFPVAASEFPEGVSRRRWMKLMGASMAMAGVAGCRYPEEAIAPFVVRPEGRIPGESYSRATNFELADRVYNLLISNVDGRPLKIEPNNDHPTGGGTDAYAQASILSLYDPDRSRGDEGFLRHKKDGGTRRFEVNWDEFDTYGSNLVKSLGSGARFGVLVGPTSSPSTVRMLKALKKRLPESTLARYDGVWGDAMRVATTRTLGKPAQQVLDLGKAKVIVAIQADILGADIGMVQNASAFSTRRDPVNGDMNRLYVVEGGYSQTGATADARLAIRPSQMKAFIAELGRRVAAMKSGEAHSHGDQSKPYDELSAEDRMERFLDAVAHDVADAGGEAVVVVGDHLGAEAISAGIQMNKTLGSFGSLQSFRPQVDGDLGDTVSLSDMATKMNAGELDSVLIIGVNPISTAPGDVDFAAALSNVAESIYLSEYDDETGVACKWSIPLAHPLESWGDVIDSQGSYGVCQPQILPLLGGRSVSEVLSVMLGQDKTSGLDITRATADEVAGSSLSDRQWRALLHDGFSGDIKGEAGDLSVGGDANELTSDAPVAVSADDIDQNDFDVIFTPADGLYDGRFANNGWLQEMPQSLTKMSWDNAAIMSPASAKTLGVKHGLTVAIRVGDAKVKLPVYEMPGYAPGVISVQLGYGRTVVGNVGGNPDKDVPIVGVDVSPIRTSESMLVALGVEARPDYTEYEIATTQDHWAIDEGGKQETEDRSFNLVREGTLALFDKVPGFAEAPPKEPHVPLVGDHQSPFTEPIHDIEETPENQFEERLPQWGMAIDLSKCVGCNACVVACQSENNVPIVGREQILNSREMHWLRLDRYFQGDAENADIVQQPVACMHCETAPCEQVCPVAATVHTKEGLNAMAYNRCIGTRYCANNCPFKVRRFNYFNYNADIGVGYGVDSFPGNIESANRKLQALVMNPEVTVRGRGVMEKCTYCVQRIEKAKIETRKDGGRQIEDGDVVTACQAACPSKAIEFGNLTNPESAVSKQHADPRSYGMLSQLNVKPRTEYLAKVRNTPGSLMTAAQLKDLATITAPHHGGHGDHGDDHHGDEHHDGDGHEGDDHKKEAAHG
ncbi:TAT-variant-translocated molybdopterin oxidoreductase [Planctomycetes bacterium K23_9]|uniref:Tetrathionate reductase subunit B n=1 Tax=Stieleria marina TaxID=1930275 RepID=A0A517NS28_9BACT|nr:Tetrathionate reductase subunit B precursor [Planctomycetes bacterium K23_9]